LTNAIIQTAQVMFQVKANIVSEHYSGENFTSKNILCYRLSYLSPERVPLQVFLLYEEQLPLSTLSEMLGRSIKTTDQMIAYAIQVLSQQFVKRIKLYFPSEKAYTLEKTDMLTFDQLLQNFDKEYPPYSFLFNTDGHGYFACCIK
ncbi:MAG: hypothetical protein HFI37_07730, partial [Lachnospiraceae bacterium]|nr:hypothetical protein [Lachnospiraceae bacterium]